MMHHSWGKILGYSLLTLVLLNIFYAFFLYQKKYEPVTLSLTVEADFNSYTWFTVQSNYSDSILRTETKPITKGKANTLTTILNEPEGLQFLGFYWSNSDKGTISISDVSLEANGKTRVFDNLEKFVNYSSNNVTPVSTETAITATSNQEANGWLMVNLEGVEKISKIKKFKPMGWITNILVFLLLCLAGRFYNRNIETKRSFFKIEGSVLYKTRNYLFYLWMLLLPFWLIISHILLAVSLALGIAHFIVERQKFQRKELKSFIPLFVLFFVIMVVNTLFHSESIGTDFGDYSYFLLAPFLFLGIQRDELVKIFKVFQLAVGTYILLLSIAILERYFQLPSSYTFSFFFFEIVETYWHTSYLAGLIVVALLFEFQHKKFDITLLVLSLVAFVFMYLAQARLPLLIGLILIIMVTIIKFPKKLKYSYITVSAVLVVLAGIFVYTSNEARDRITTIFLVNDTKKMDARPELWKEALSVSSKNMLLGIGSGNVRDVLSKDLEDGSEIKYRRYNAHNQYLEFLLAYGILVPALLVLVLVIPVVLGFKSTALFVVYFSIAMLVESYFSRQAGVVVFSVFYCFFILYDCKSKQNTSASSQ